MIDFKEQHEVIVETLLEKGAFAISDIEKSSKLSRGGIQKRLQKLVAQNILRQTAQRGSHVRYTLAMNDVAIHFLCAYVDQFTINDIARMWGVAVTTAKKYIKDFVDRDVIVKNGRPPQKIIYTQALAKNKYSFTQEQKDVIEKNYIYTTPDGRMLHGVRGFVYWAENRSGRNDINKLAQEYVDTRKRYYGNQETVFLIDATKKLENVFGIVYVEKLFHRDFDALPVFGKTTLSQMVRTAKSGRTDTTLMMSIVRMIGQSIDEIVTRYDIDCVGFIPPTVSRKTQLMDFIARRLRINCQRIAITKKRGLVPVQQKSLKKLDDRVLNARQTIIIDDEKHYSHILLIDDVTGSGATLNEVAKKLITRGTAQKVYALTITGSAKAGVFDVISEA